MRCATWTSTASRSVNDSCGHTAGDNMLREVATLIKDAVRDSDTVGRIGGDEFALLLVGCPLEKARQIADDVVRSVNDYRFVWKDRIFNIGVSIGLVEIGRDSGAHRGHPEFGGFGLLRRQEAGRRPRTRLFGARGGQCAASRRDPVAAEAAGRAARQPLRAVFPAHRSRAGGRRERAGAGGVRAARRRERPAGGAAGRVPARRRALPADAARSIAGWCRRCSSALGRGGLKVPEGRSVAINIAGQTLGDAEFLEFVVECFDHTGAIPADICFEVTESSVVANLDHARRFIEVLHGMGCEFALDDFGSGLCSFATLKTLPMDYLKIDGSFIRNLAGDSVNQAMVPAMIDLSRSLNFRVVAEQVEDQLSLDTVRNMGIDFVQGFAVGRPKPLSITPGPASA